MAKTKKPPTADLVGVGELAERFKVKPQLAHKWTLSKRFPEPAYELRSGRLWDFSDIVSWILEHRPDLVKRLPAKLRPKAKK